MPDFWGVGKKINPNFFSGQPMVPGKDTVYDMANKIAEWRLLAQKLNKKDVAKLLTHCEARIIGVLDGPKNTPSSVHDASQKNSSTSFRP